MESLWTFEEVKVARKPVLNPRPVVPETGWKRPTGFPSLAGASALALDLETYDPDLKEMGPGWARGVGEIVGVSIATNDGFCAYYPIRHREEPEDNFEPEQVLSWLRKELSRPQQLKVGHHIIYDAGWLASEGVEIKGRLWDTFTAERLIMHQDDASLEATAQRRIGEGKSSEALYRWAWEYYGRGKNPTPDQLRSMIAFARDTPPRLMGPYAESDTRLPLEIMKVQHRILEENGLMDVFRMENMLIPLLVKMRLAGVSVDIPAAERADAQFTRDIDVLQREVDHIAGGPVNAGSGDEIGRVFDKLGIKYPLTEKTQKPSIKAEFLETVDHPLAAKLVELAELKKYRGTFIRGYILSAHKGGRIFPEFNPMRAVTGRMSSSSPNAQNLPSRNHLAKAVRSIFIPDPGHSHWASFDYASVESRILAHYATGVGSDELREEYNRNPATDYHAFTIDLVKKVTGFTLPRKHAKMINFGLCYGASEKKLSKMLGISKEESDPLFEAFHGGLPYVKDTMSAISREAAQKGFTTTIMGRRSHFEMWEPAEGRGHALKFEAAISLYGGRIRRAYLHKALNHKIQGGASDLMKAAMVTCFEEGIFDATTVPRMVIHDALDWSVPDDTPSRREAFREMKHKMETALEFKVPIRADGQWGNSWGNLFPLEL